MALHGARCVLDQPRLLHYTVQVLSRWANNALVANTVTDPYSLSLSANSSRSVVANLDNPALNEKGRE